MKINDFLRMKITPGDKQFDLIKNVRFLDDKKEILVGKGTSTVNGFCEAFFDYVYRNYSTARSAEKIIKQNRKKYTRFSGSENMILVQKILNEIIKEYAITTYFITCEMDTSKNKKENDGVQENNQQAPSKQQISVQTQGKNKASVDKTVQKTNNGSVKIQTLKNELERMQPVKEEINEPEDNSYIHPVMEEFVYPEEPIYLEPIELKPIEEKKDEQEQAQEIKQEQIANDEPEVLLGDEEIQNIESEVVPVQDVIQSQEQQVPAIETVDEEVNINLLEAVQAQDSVQYEEAVQSQDTVQFEEAVQSQDTIQFEDAVQLEEAVQSQDTIQLEEAVQSQDAVQLEEVVQSQDAVQLEKVVQSQDQKELNNKKSEHQGKHGKNKKDKKGEFPDARMKPGKGIPPIKDLKAVPKFQAAAPSKKKLNIDEIPCIAVIEENIVPTMEEVPFIGIAEDNTVPTMSEVPYLGVDEFGNPLTGLSDESTLQDEDNKVQIEAEATVQQAPIRTEAPVQQTPVRTEAPVQQAPVRTEAPVQQAPVRQAPVRTEAPVQQAPVRTETPVQQATVRTETPVQQIPVRSEAPVRQAPVRTEAPVQQAPVRTEAPVQQAPVRTEAPVQQAPVRAEAPVQQAPVRTETPVQQTPVRAEAPVQQAPVRAEAPVQQTPVRAEAPVQQAPVKAEAPVQQTPVRTEAPVQQAPVKAEAPLQQAPVKKEVPIQADVPVKPVPVQKAAVKQETFGKATGNIYEKKNIKDIKQIISFNLQRNKQVIFSGPSGTGKTHHVRKYIRRLTKGYDGFKFVQFHPTFEYADFIEGLRPANIINTTTPTNVRLDGIFKAFCRKIVEDNLVHAVPGFATMYSEKKQKIMQTLYENIRDKKEAIDEGLTNEYFPDDSQEAVFERGVREYYFVIDELNRAEVTKIFGDVLFALDEDYRGIENRFDTRLSNLKTYRIIQADDIGKANYNTSHIGYAEQMKFDCFEYGFFIPRNLHIIGTMNEIGSSLHPLDFAVKHRFRCINIDTDEIMLSLLQEIHKDKYIYWLERFSENLNRVNKLITEGFSSEYRIGPGYFRNLNEAPESIDIVYDNEIVPLLQEYLKGKPQDITDRFIAECKRALRMGI